MEQPVGVLCALAPELGRLAGLARGRRSVQNLELLELPGELPTLACVAGVGKVHAARGAALLLASGARTLLVVGTCGGLSRGLAPGDLVHCTTAFQVDLALREGRSCDADGGLRERWERVAPGQRGWFLTADRPVLTPWRRLRLARAFRGPCVADMETAAAAAVARAAGVPFAGLRVVTDRAGWGTPVAFRANFPRLAGVAADTLPGLLGWDLPAGAAQVSPGPPAE